MKILAWGFFLNFLFLLPLFGQSLKVEGIVTDEISKEALPGVNIVIKGTYTGTMTGIDGSYSIDIPDENSSLVFSFVGMMTLTEEVNGRSRIDIELGANMEQIDDVIVVAYGTSTKESYTGAATVVDKETIEERPVTSFEKALQGTTAGLQVTSSSGQPGANATIRIRGIGSLSASSSPLYVIDGVPMSGSISDINPNDIESITVLKDAAASSLYGSRAANGVIIITTKQGKTGQTQISFSSQLGVSSLVSEGYPLMNSSQFYEQTWAGLYNQALIDGQTITESRDFAHNSVEDIVGFNPTAINDPLDNNGRLKPGTKILTNTDWRDQIYNTGVIQNYNLSASGGTESTKVFLSLGYLEDSGTTLSSDFKRYTAKLNVRHRVNRFITAGMSNILSHSLTHSPPGGSAGANPVRSAEVINSASPVKNADGTYNWDNKAVFDFNPVGLAEMDKYEYKTNRALFNAYLDLDILPFLKFKTTGAVDYSGNKGLNYYNPFHGNGAGVNGRSSQARSENIAWNVSNILSYNLNSNDYTLEAILGQEAHGEEYSVLSAGVTDFSIPGRPELVWGAQPDTPGSYSTNWTMISYLGQIRFNYKGKYNASASLRGDGSSRFGDNNKYGLFYSVGLSWRITEETWIPEYNWLNTLKLRSSYGTSGNNSIGNYASLGLYGSGANYGGYPGLTPVQPENRNLSWEKISSLNLGLETRLFSNLDASFEFYKRNSSGLLYARPLSSGKGFTSIMTNLGAMVNSGIEAELSYEVFKSRSSQNTIGFNISTNNNRILNLATDKIISGTKLLEVGGDIYQFYMREWAGVDPGNGKPMWYTNQSSDDVENIEEPGSSFEDPLNSGRMVTSDFNDAERIRLGSALPDVYGGLNNNFKYRNFDLNFYFYYSIGGQVYNYDYAANMHDGTQPGNNLSLDALDAWTPDNKFTDTPRYVINNQDMGNQMSTRFLEDASYVRLKNITIAYYLPDNWCERIKVRSLKAYISGENIWTKSTFRGFDPEGAINGTTSSSIPGVRIVSIGLKVDL